MSHYSDKSIPGEKFECGNFSSFGDMTSQIFPQKKGRVVKFGYLPPENGFNFKKLFFMSRIVLFDPKFTPQVNFSNFQVGEIFL